MSRYVPWKSNNCTYNHSETSNTNWNSQGVLSIIILLQKGIDYDPEVSDECAVVGSLDRIKVIYLKYYKEGPYTLAHKQRSVYSKMINNHISVLLGKNAKNWPGNYKKYFKLMYSLRFVDHLNSNLVCQITRPFSIRPNGCAKQLLLTVYSTWGI